MDELERQAAVLLGRATAPPLDAIRARAAQLRRRRRATFTAVAVLVVAAATGAVSSQLDEGARQVGTVDAPPTTAAPPAVPLPSLPATGLAVQTDSGVRLVDLDGAVIATLDGYTLAPNWRPDHGVRVVDTGGTPFALDPSAGELVAADLPPPEAIADRPSLAPPPATADVTAVVGHWRWILPSPDGTRRLAQWSGECENPMALVIGADGVPRSVFGGSWIDAPTSFALGWAPDGRAVVHTIGQPGCGGGMREGVHLVDADGASTFVVDGSAAQLWTPRPQVGAETTIAPTIPQTATVAPQVPVTTWPSTIADRLILRGSAIGPVSIGDDADAAVAELTAILGAPRTDERHDTREIGFPTEICGTEIRYVAWGGLGLMFNSEGGTVGGLLQWTLSGDQPPLRLPSGVQIGMLMVDVVARETEMRTAPGDPVDPNSYQIGSSPGAIRLRGATRTDEHGTVIDGPRIDEMRGGHVECIGD